MPEQSRPSAAGIESTYKAREVEGFLDVHFYRKAGFILARAAAALGLTPSAVTFAGGLLGISAGHLYFYPSLPLNVVGMLLQIASNIFDNADGQLARLTGKQSRTGRILDGYIDHLVWLSIYVHLIWRCAAHPWHPAVLIIGIMAAFSHTFRERPRTIIAPPTFIFAKAAIGWTILPSWRRNTAARHGAPRGRNSCSCFIATIPASRRCFLQGCMICAKGRRVLGPRLFHASSSGRGRNSSFGAC